MFHTIAAVSTPPGRGGVALIRVSGADAVEIASRIFFPAGASSLADAPARRAIFGEIRSPRTGEVLDTGIAVLFRAPASFTGEDTAEISCHGGTAVTRAVLSAAFEAGAEPAGPGDFTRRAFVNGKMTLTEAEAVGLLIDADTESRRALAAGAARGNISRALDTVAASLTGVLSALYAAIDYPEEDVGDEGERQIRSVIDAAREQISRLCATYKAGCAIAEGISTVILGVPNSGKSSLYNELLGRQDAIVTDIPGTTRDVLSASVDVGGATLRLFDTAGIRESADAVEQIGVERARERLRDAALVLLVVDASAPMGEECRQLCRDVRREAPAASVIGVLNKADLGYALPPSDEELLWENCTAQVRLSVKEGSGLDSLRREIARLAGTDRLSPATDAILWDARQLASLRRAEELLAQADEGLAAGAPLDAVCTDCEAALSEISGVDGRAVDEAIIDGIFARFCVGK